MANAVLDKMIAAAQQSRRIELEARRIVAPYKANAKNQYENARYSGKYNALVVDQLDKLDYCCPVCTKDLKATAATLDHIEPKSKYFHKATDKSNFLVMCNLCNKSKGDQEFQQWRDKLIPLSKRSLDYSISLIHGKARLDELLSKEKAAVA